ncbi:MAG: 50S ribosomal protein L32 [Thermodesulfobacteriota bacterium]
MALPKRKHSKARSAKRRTHYKVTKPGLSICSNCGELKTPHRVCPSCGYYKGRIFKKEPED